MTALHIYTAGKQPATRFLDYCGEPVAIDHRRIIRCCRCNRLRWAKNMTVLCYYDGWLFACVDKAKCKAVRRGKR